MLVCLTYGWLKYRQTQPLGFINLEMSILNQPSIEKALNFLEFLWTTVNYHYKNIWPTNDQIQTIIPESHFTDPLTFLQTFYSKNVQYQLFINMYIPGFKLISFCAVNPMLYIELHRISYTGHGSWAFLLKLKNSDVTVHIKYMQCLLTALYTRIVCAGSVLALYCPVGQP